MALTLPRLDASPYDDPNTFVATWATTMALIEAASGSGSGADINAPWFYKTGRAISSPLPSLAPSPALGVYLPTGFQWFQNGVMITLSAPVLVTGLAQNYDGYAVLLSTADGEDWIWSIDGTATAKSTFASGSGIIGHVITDSSGLTSIVATVSNADLVYDMPTIVAALSGLSGGGGSGFIGDGSWLASDPRPTSIVIAQDLAANLAAAIAAAALGGVIPSTNETDHIQTWLLNFRNILGKSDPSLLVYQLGSGAEPELFGTPSSPSTELMDLGGTLPEGDREYDSR